MFGSVAPILDKDDDESPYGDAFKVRRILNFKIFEKINDYIECWRHKFLNIDALNYGNYSRYFSFL